MSESPAIDSALLNALVLGAEKIFENAENLYREGLVLAKEGAIARALFLHQISLEECSKIDNMGAWVVSLVSGHEVNQTKMLAAFARHSSKNKTNAYMLEGSEAEEAAKKRGDWKAARNEFRKFQADFHERSNTAKNAALYVDWKAGEFVAPKERISVEMLNEVGARNESFLGYAYNNLRMLKRVAEKPEEMRSQTEEFIAAAEKLRAAKPEDAGPAIDSLIADFLSKPTSN